MGASEIIVRNIQFGISKAPNGAWLDNDVLSTVQVDALAIQIPPGERFFIRSLRRWEDKLDDPHLVSEIRGYSKQEALHTREHEDYNAALRALGHDVDAMDAEVAHQLRVDTPYESVVMTCAIEQITYTASMLWLRKVRGKPIAQPYRAMWLWHSVEEIEHAAVGIDVLNAITKDWHPLKRYLYRVLIFLAVLTNFSINGLRFGLRLQKEREGKRTVWSVMRYLWVALVSPGLVRHLIINNLGYLKPGYRPDPAKNIALLTEARADLDEAVEDMNRFFAAREEAAPRDAPVRELATAL